MQKALRVLNNLVSEHVFSGYAIGGAMGATFYIEPVFTIDLDVFIVFPPDALIVTLDPIYRALEKKGYHPDPVNRECVDIEGTPVQFLPAYNSLLLEACAAAKPFIYEGVPTRVLQAEYLVAVALQTGRGKDRLRVQNFAAAGVLDSETLNRILTKYSLAEKYRSWTTNPSK